ncbi:MAG: ABC transporter permease subunit [Clostridiaceae bacterium]|nr:ABC transporter permease subunit [Clostridiaceae bacterium]
MIIKVAKNELRKVFYSKQFYVLLVFIIIMSFLSAYLYGDIRNSILSGTVDADRYSAEVKQNFINMNAITFMQMLLTDFIFKPMIPFFAIFMVVFAVKTFAEDNVSGRLKFTILECDQRAKICYGKLLYLFIITFIGVLMNFVCGFLLGSFIFGLKGVTAGNFLSEIGMYVSAIIPIVSFAAIIGVISMVASKNNTFIVIGVMSSILISLLDKFTVTKYYSPLGIITRISQVGISDISKIDLLQSNLVSAIYIVITIIIGSIIFNRKEWKY